MPVGAAHGFLLDYVSQNLSSISHALHFICVYVCVGVGVGVCVFSEAGT